MRTRSLGRAFFLFTLFLLAPCFFVLLVCFSAVAEEKMRIGVSVPLTGNAATYGVDTQNVLIFANEKLADGKYEFVFEDDKCSGRDAVAIAHRFVGVLKLPYVLGFPCSGPLLSAAKLYERAKVVVIAATASAPAISQAGEYIFRTCPSDDGSAKMLYEYVEKRHSRFGVLSEQTEFSQGLLQAFLRSNEGGQLKIETEDFLTDSTDFRTLLLRLRSKKIEGLFINGQSEATFLTALKQLREIGWDVPVYSAYMATTKTFLDNAGPLSEGIVCVDYPEMQSVGSSEGLALYKEYVSRFGNMKSLELNFVTTFESFRALHEAINSGEEVKEFLNQAQFKGVAGEWSFDENGDIRGIGFVLKQIKGGKPVTLN